MSISSSGSPIKSTLSAPAFNNFSLNIFASLLSWDKSKLPDKTILVTMS